MLNLETYLNKLHRGTKPTVDLMEHHANIAYNYAERQGSPEMLARQYIDGLEKRLPGYRLEIPQFRGQFEAAFKVAIEAARKKQINIIPDYQRPDIICVNCNHVRCEMEMNVKTLRQRTLYHEWEEKGIKPLAYKVPQSPPTI